MIETTIVRALSVRQPYIELILRGVKRVEYRSRPTRVRERVFLYASTLAAGEQAFLDAGFSAAELPVGMLLGTVEIADCIRGLEWFEWQLALPQRLDPPRKPIRRPQPMFFFPFDLPAPVEPATGANRRRH